MNELRKIKIGEDGKQLPLDAPEWVAVLLPDHDLMFTRYSIVDGRRNQPACLEAAQSLRLAGYGDWDLPTPAELSLLIDRDRFDPAIDTNFFTIQSEWFWTKQIAAWTDQLELLSAYAWFVNFYYGTEIADQRDHLGFALAVRRVQAGRSAIMSLYAPMENNDG